MAREQVIPLNVTGSKPVIVEVRPSNIPGENAQLVIKTFNEDDMETRIPISEEIQQHPLVQEVKPITSEDVQKKESEMKSQKEVPLLFCHSPFKNELKRHRLVQEINPITNEDVQRKTRLLQKQQEFLNRGPVPQLNNDNDDYVGSVPFDEQIREHRLVQHVKPITKEDVERKTLVMKKRQAHNLDKQEMEEEKLPMQEEKEEKEEREEEGQTKNVYDKELAVEKARGRIYLGEASLREGVRRLKTKKDSRQKSANKGAAESF